MELPDLDRIKNLGSVVYTTGQFGQKDSLATYFRNWKANGQNVRDDVGDGVAEMHGLRGQAVRLLRRRTGPVRVKASPAEKEQREEIAKHPRYDDGDHGPIRPFEGLRDALGKDASVKEEEAQFDAAERGDLDELAGPTGLLLLSVQSKSDGMRGCSRRWHLDVPGRHLRPSSDSQGLSSPFLHAGMSPMSH